MYSRGFKNKMRYSTTEIHSRIGLANREKVRNRIIPTAKRSGIGSYARTPTELVGGDFLLCSSVGAFGKLGKSTEISLL